MQLTARVTEEAFDLPALCRQFNARETTATGTVVIHHGKIKYPGKKVPDFGSVLLEPLVPDPAADLARVGADAGRCLPLEQVFILHRLGRGGAGDDVLLVMVSAATRKAAFAACAGIVDEIKTEKIIRLVELPS